MIIASEALLTARATKAKEMLTDVLVAYFDGRKGFGAVRAWKRLFRVVHRLHVAAQIGKATKQRGADLTHEPLFFGMHEQMIGQMRLLFETNVARVAFVLLADHVVAFMLVERRRR